MAIALVRMLAVLLLRAPRRRAVWGPWLVVTNTGKGKNTSSEGETRSDYSTVAIDDSSSGKRDTRSAPCQSLNSGRNGKSVS
jgi:hypothetical protein